MPRASSSPRSSVADRLSIKASRSASGSWAWKEEAASGDAPPEVRQEQESFDADGDRGSGESQRRERGDQEAVALDEVPPHAIAILESVPELAERMDVTQRAPRVQSRPCMAACSRAGRGLTWRRRCGVPADGRPLQKCCATAAAAQALNPHPIHDPSCHAHLIREAQQSSFKRRYA